MIISWDLMLHIVVASFLFGYSFQKRAYWFSAFFGLLVLEGVVAAIGNGASV